MKRILFLLSLFASPSFAETPMNGAEFEAFTTGKTFTFDIDGLQYGAEEYLSNRRVRWSFVEGQDIAPCDDGIWYESDANICFQYENTRSPQCWQFFRTPDGLRAEYRSDPENHSIYDARKSSEPLLCLGPNIGV